MAFSMNGAVRSTPGPLPSGAEELRRSRSRDPPEAGANRVATTSAVSDDSGAHHDQDGQQQECVASQIAIRAWPDSTPGACATVGRTLTWLRRQTDGQTERQSETHTHTQTPTHTLGHSLCRVISCRLQLSQKMLSCGVLGLAPCHFTCRNTCRYRWLIRPPFPHLGI